MTRAFFYGSENFSEILDINSVNDNILIYMKLSNYTLQASQVIVQEVERKARDIIFDFSSAVSRCVNPPDVVRIYSERLSELNSMWKQCVRHHIRYGRQTQSIYIDSCNHYAMSNYIAERFNFQIHHGNDFKRINYTYDKFLDLCQMEVALLISKYTEVYKFEVEIAVLQLLLHYFSIYSVDGWNGDYCYSIDANDICKVITALDSNDMQLYERYAKRVGDFTPTMLQPSAVRVKKPKPTCKEDIERCIMPDMTQSEIAESVCDNWHVSRRTAYRLMTQYGFTRDKKASAEKRPDLAEVPTVEQQQYVDSFNSLPDNPYILKTMVHSWQCENKKLKEEIERLTAEIERLKSSDK